MHVFDMNIQTFRHRSIKFGRKPTKGTKSSIYVCPQCMFTPFDTGLPQ